MNAEQVKKLEAVLAEVMGGKPGDEIVVQLNENNVPDRTRGESMRFTVVAPGKVQFASGLMFNSFGDGLLSKEVRQRVMYGGPVSKYGRQPSLQWRMPVHPEDEQETPPTPGA